MTFRVDAYPTEEFQGTVSQVRLEPKTEQNVVSYTTIIDVSNDELLLKPGMTASVAIELASARGVLKVPTTALRFRPTADVFAAEDGLIYLTDYDAGLYIVRWKGA